MILSIDDRMKDSSGIGTYLTNIMNRLPETITQKYYSNYCPYIKHYNPLEQISLTYFEHKVAYDLFWSPNFNTPWIKPKKLVVTIHDCAHFTNYIDLKKIEKNYAQILYKIAALNASKIITNSTFSANQISHYLGVKAEKIEPITLGVDDYWFRPSINKNPYDFPYFYFVGNLKKNKNLLMLLKAFKKVMHKIPEKLIIVGQKDGFRTPDFQWSEIEKEFEGKVIFEGKVSNDSLKTISQHAKALIFPSSYEGFGLPVVEAMALGTPVLCHDIEILRENFSKMATFFSSEEELAKMMASSEIGRTKSGDLIETVRHKFSWSKAAKEHVQIFEAMK